MYARNFVALLSVTIHLLVGLSGCGPAEGDIYENLLTGERIELDGTTDDCQARIKFVDESSGSLLDHMVTRGATIQGPCAYVVEYEWVGSIKFAHVQYYSTDELKHR